LNFKDRARACCVCRAWQQAVAGDGALWEALDLGEDWTLAVLNGAVTRAQGRLRSLSLFSDDFAFEEQLLREGVLPVLQRSPSLRHLCMIQRGSPLNNWSVSKMNLELVAEAGTQLETLVCSVYCDGADALALLTKQAPFGALQLEGLAGMSPAEGESAQLLEILASNMGQQPSLLYLSLRELDITTLRSSTPFFDALLTSQITSLSFAHCHLGVNFAAGFARLLQAGRLERLDLLNCLGMFTLEATAQLSLALRNSRSLLELQISSCEEANAVLHLILQALAPHPTLKTLTLCQRFSAATRDAIVRVIADSTILWGLFLESLREDEVSLAALAGAVQQSRSLQALHLSYVDDDVDPSTPTASAYEEHLQPAVQACTSLRSLVVDIEGNIPIGLRPRPVPEAAAVVQLVTERGLAQLAAMLAKEPGRSA